MAKRFEGKPCKKCLNTTRYESNRSCVECARAYERKRYSKMSQEELARRYAYAAEYRKDPENRRIAAERTKKWVSENREYVREWHRRYRKENREKVYAWIRSRRAIKNNAPGHHTADDVLAIGERQRWRCAWCGIRCAEDYHVDHVTPLAKGGTNWPDNLCIACPTCNMSKKDKMPHEFAQTMGKLL